MRISCICNIGIVVPLKYDLMQGMENSAKNAQIACTASSLFFNGAKDSFWNFNNCIYVPISIRFLLIIPGWEYLR